MIQVAAQQDVEMKPAPDLAREPSVERQLDAMTEETGLSIEEDMNAASPETPSQTKMTQIVAEYRRVRDASGSEITRKRTAVRAKCQERLWMAAVWRDYQLDIVKRSFDAEIRQIEREHQHEFNALKETLMQELQEERRRLDAIEQNGNAELTIDKTGNVVVAVEPVADSAAPNEDLMAGRRLRRRDERAETGNGGNAASATGSVAQAVASGRRKQANNVYTYNTLLQDQDILDDLGAIAREAGSLGLGRRAGTKAPAGSVSSGTGTSLPSTSAVAAAVPEATVESKYVVSYERGCLHYNWDIVSVGDCIRIQLSPASGVSSVIVTGLSATDLTIQQSSLKTVRVPLTELKSGKVVILLDGADGDMASD